MPEHTFLTDEQLSLIESVNPTGSVVQRLVADIRAYQRDNRRLRDGISITIEELKRRGESDAKSR